MRREYRRAYEDKEGHKVDDLKQEGEGRAGRGKERGRDSS